MFTCIFWISALCTHKCSHSKREVGGGGVSGGQIYVLVSFWMETFVRLSCLPLCQPANTSLMEWAGKRVFVAAEEDIAARPGTHTHALFPHKHIRICLANGQISHRLIVSAAHLYESNCYEFVHLLISCWQVTESPQSPSELWDFEDLYFRLRGRKLKRPQLNRLSFWEEISSSVDFWFCIGNVFAKLSTSLKQCNVSIMTVLQRG